MKLELDHFTILGTEFAFSNLTIIWSIKEALYKFYSKPGISLKKQLLVIPFDDENKTTAWILDSENRLSCNAIFLEFEKYIFAITTRTP